MASLVNPSHNYSLFSVPVAYVLAMWPSVYGKLKAGKVFDPANPREFNEAVKSSESIDKITKNRILRSQAASANAFETLSLFVGGILAANLAGVPIQTTNLLASGYLAFRFIFNITYVWLQDNRKFAVVRSIAFNGSMVCWMTMYIKAGLLLLASSK
ncbi:hypothetical protein NLU13_8782 [Sarocladium strictum]|uniref:Uncharacterized protein n=1 Tax=Sarocladium strictum TaxID=5046 RepID=A0AA39G997_SARSR|nr:hypothetical protein NLU13_8782 [Sarocladium strictum]